MKTFGVALLAAILGYIVGLFGTMAAIELFSSNTHDKSMEAAMTGAFCRWPVVSGDRYDCYPLSQTKKDFREVASCVGSDFTVAVDTL